MPTRTVTRRYLSASTNGSTVIGNTASPGTLLHTSVNDSTNNSFDEVYVEVSNLGNLPIKVYVGIGDMTDPTNICVNGLTIPANSARLPILQGKMLAGGLNCRGYANTASNAAFDGWVRRTTITS